MRKVTAILLSALLAMPGLAQTPTGKTSFNEIAAHLDSGGNLYFYVSTEEWVRGLSRQISEWRDMYKGMATLSPDEQQNLTRTFDVLNRLVKNSGVEEISGFGMSSIAVDKDLYRSKTVLHHYKGNANGYLWSLFGKQPHALSGLDLLPANTALASFSDVDMPQLWSVLNKEIGQSGIPGAGDALKALTAQLALLTKGNPDNAIASLGGEIGIVVTLDETAPVPSPGPVPMLPQIPNVGLMLVLKVTNDLIFDLAAASMDGNPAVLRTDRPGLRMRTMPGPPLPVPVRPSIARSGDYLFVASTDALIEAAVDASAGRRPGLKSTAEFKRLLAGLPQQGNAFNFVSQRFGETLTRFMSSAGPMASSETVPVRLMMSLFGPTAMYRVSTITDEGWISAGNGGQNPANWMMLSSLAGPLILSSVILPTVLGGRRPGGGGAASNDSSAVANLRTIATAEITYQASTGGRFGDIRALIDAGLLDSRFMRPVAGYQFDVIVSARGFLATATPVSPNGGRFGYYVNQTGVVRYSLDPKLAPEGQNGQPVQ